MPAVVLDAGPWWQVLVGSPAGRELWRRHAPGGLVITPSVVVAELLDHLHRHGLGRQAPMLHEVLVSSSAIEPAGTEVSVLAGRLLRTLQERDRRATVVHALVLATARTHGARLVSDDPVFAGEPDLAPEAPPRRRSSPGVAMEGDPGRANPAGPAQ